MICSYSSLVAGTSSTTESYVPPLLLPGPLIPKVCFLRNSFFGTIIFFLNSIFILPMILPKPVLLLLMDFSKFFFGLRFVLFFKSLKLPLNSELINWLIGSSLNMSRSSVYSSCSLRYLGFLEISNGSTIFLTLLIFDSSSWKNSSKFLRIFCSDWTLANVTYVLSLSWPQMSIIFMYFLRTLFLVDAKLKALLHLLKFKSSSNS